MDAVSGMEASTPSGGLDGLLTQIRRLSAVADSASEPDAVFRALAGELLTTPGAEEVHVHHLGRGSAEDRVAVYMFAGNGRVTHLVPRSQRPPGVSWVASTGRSFLAADAEELASSVPRLSATGPVCCALLLPLTERGQVAAVVVLVRRISDVFAGSAVELAAALVDQASTALALVRARAEAGTDPVTGSMNHRAMRRRLGEEIDRARRTGAPLSSLILDLDDFKLVNDRHGHQAGDELLREVVRALLGEFRAFDRVARYGGDEFVVILPNADLPAAATAAARALDRLRELTDPDGDGISASFGVAQWEHPMGTDELLEACDAALLRAKRQGKGRVTRAPEPSL
jgi:diguanylate cyclase (GGDEF)-like protein